MFPLINSEVGWNSKRSKQNCLLLVLIVRIEGSINAKDSSYYVKQLQYVWIDTFKKFWILLKKKKS